MIPKEYVDEVIDAFREEAPGPSEHDVDNTPTYKLMMAGFHALDREYDVSEIADNEMIRRRHLAALVTAIWYENNCNLGHPEEKEDVERIIEGLLTPDA